MDNFIGRYIAFKREKRNYYIILLEALLIGFIVSLFIDKFIWWRNTGVVHSAFELISILFNMSLFFIVWNKYESNPSSSRIIAFGALTTTIFSTAHIYFYEPLGIYTGNNIDLSGEFWALIRFTEIFIIFIASFDFKGIKLNKWSCLLIAFLYPLYLLYLNINYVEVLQLLFGYLGLIRKQTIPEFIVIVLAMISLSRHRRKINERGYISYEYLALAIIVIIPIEVSILFYRSYSSSTVIYLHVFRIIYCYFLYKSIFKSSVDYPYSELEKSRKRLNDILNALPVGVLTFDSDLKVDFVNGHYEKLLCCKREDIIGLSNRELLGLFTKDDNKVKEPIAEKVMQSGKDIKNFIRTYLNSEGSSVKVQTDGVQIEDGVILIARDARIEQEIDNLSLQTHTILNSMKNAAFICDNRGNIINTNKSLRELSGVSDDEAIGLNLNELKSLISYSIKKRLSLRQNSENSIDEQFEATFTNREGRTKEVLVHRAQIFNLYRENIGAIYVITDISELKEQQQKIFQQEKLALLGQMGATIVHETRNFLTTIKGCSQLIEVTAQQENVVQYAKKINKNTDEVNRIISDFLSLSKPKKAIKEEIAVCDLMASMEETLGSSSLIKGVNINFIYNIDERYVLCDEAQLKQVALNLCKNAIEAMAETPNPELIIEAGIKEDDIIYIRVSDNGKGMSEENLAKIGTPFFTTKQGGTGLGLSVCYDIVKEHGGWINVTSKEGVGTTFTIYLPGLEDEESLEAI
jgi:PAS domain S-box-containing protein